jgi:uncharacterized membrane protein YdbT with pleckstrin-like domain
MGYVAKVIRSDEKILAEGKLHWIIFWPAIACFVVAVIAAVLSGMAGISGIVGIIAALLALIVALIGLFLAAREGLQRWGTEIAVTDRRVIYKTGLIRRHTAEMNMDKVESVTVTQSLLGRLLDFGSVRIRGTGEGLEHLHYISSPISLRNTITAK